MTTLCRADWVETRSDREARLALAALGTDAADGPGAESQPAAEPRLPSAAPNLLS